MAAQIRIPCGMSVVPFIHNGVDEAVVNPQVFHKKLREIHWVVPF